MASTLLAAPCFLSLQNREVGGFLRSFRSPNYDKVKYNQGLLRTRNSGTNGGGCLVVASVFGRKVKSTQTVIPEPDYRIPIVLLGLSGGLAYTNNLLPAAPIGLLGLLLLFQTTRVRFVFDDEALVCSFNPLKKCGISSNILQFLLMYVHSACRFSLPFSL
ncbi:unnamed protein product [Prunus armeniaca]